MAELSIRLNNSVMNDPCALCGELTKPQVGAEVFLGDALVCHRCGEKHAPESWRSCGWRCALRTTT